MVLGDLPAVVRWRQQPHVDKWYAADGPATLAAVTEHYAPAIDGEDPTRMWVVEANGRSVGMVQDYLISDHPDYAVLTPDPAAIGVDYLIGEPAWVGRGVGTQMLQAWLRVARAGYPDATSYFAAPDHRNVRSRRLLLKVGFVEGTWFDEPQADGSVATVVGHTLDVRTVLG